MQNITRQSEQFFQDFNTITDATERSQMLLMTDDGADITFGDILANPDDILLNFRWAKAQMARGNMRGAVSTLERILVLDPSLAPVRLYYAIVLFRLDSLDEARSQFELLQTLELDGEAARQINEYLRLIRERRQRVKQALTVSFGTHYDTNKNASPTSKEQLVTGTRTAISTDADLRQDDIGFIGAVRYDVSYDLGYQEGHEVFAALSGYTDDQVQLDSLDVMSADVEIGARWRALDLVITPSISQTAQALSREKFLTARTAQLRADWNVRPDTILFGQVAYSDERFQSTTDSSALVQRAGQRYTGTVGSHYTWNESQRTSVAATWSRKEAARGYYTSRSISGDINHTYLLPGGKYVIGGLTYGLDQYQEADTLVTGTTSPIRRTDNPMRLRLTYGARLGNLMESDWFDAEGAGREVYDFLAPISWSVTGEYQGAQSNITNYEYENMRAQILLSRRWDF
ncbi:MAG: hypothetical protein ABID63_08645 [Pseudomonadota bacterium]